MPRATHPGPAALRNRNRVTNKTRLKVIKDSIDADSIAIDEDEEKARVVSTAGVDAEDANEHHLQEVLSAAANRHHATIRSTRSAEKEAPAAYIPTPDSTGVVKHYEDWYPPNKWKDPTSYVKSSDTVEEAISFALVNGFIYYMDERDKEWLDKNNEEARGEGTSAQGAVSGASTRSGRSSKGKGKEPDFTHPTVISEDEFELVNAIFEKVTHEKTEFLHHGLDQGSPFPPFSDYQDTFATQLQPEMFALYAVPSWAPPPAQLLRCARIIYPYWRERRLERGGHRVIPSVNLDETDTKNESYICFRRREIKAVRKTRASQAQYSDKMIRLQQELTTTLDIACVSRERERLKRHSLSHGRAVLDKRIDFCDLKRKFPSLGTKEDEELFYDKEKPPKKPKVEPTTRPHIKLRTRDNGEPGSPMAHMEPQVRPKERLSAIQSQIAQEMQRQKEKDKQWEDTVDTPYQPSPLPLSCRLAKQIPISRDGESTGQREYRAVRLRVGRGGRRYLDRQRNYQLRTPAQFDEDADVEAQDHARRLEERWRYDNDEIPGDTTRPHYLLDETTKPRILVQAMKLLNEQDVHMLSNDPTIQIVTPEGRTQSIVPFKLGSTHSSRPMMPLPQRQPSIATLSAMSNGSAGSSSASTAQLSHQATAKKPLGSVAHMRISGGGGMRLPSTPTSAIPPLPSGSPHNTPPSSATLSNGLADAQTGAAADSGEQESKPVVPPSPNDAPPQQEAPAPAAAPPISASPSPAPAKASTPVAPVSVPNLPNTAFTGAPVNGYPAIMAKGMQYHYPMVRPGAGLALPQYMSDSSMMQANMLRQTGGYINHNAYAMQMQGGRPMQWPAIAAQRSPSLNGTEANGTDNLSTSPSRAPSANGMRVGQIPRVNQVMNSANQGRVSPAGTHMQRLMPQSPSPHILSPNLAATPVHASPNRAPAIPNIPTPSPSLQARQVVGTSGAAGY